MEWIYLAQDRTVTGSCERGDNNPGFHKMLGKTYLHVVKWERCLNAL
jgi:hypothetical protein